MTLETESKSTVSHQDGSLSNPERQRKIAHRLEDIPRIYRRIYRQAAEGKGRKAAIHAFCLECTQWEKEEVRKCVSFACPLFVFRPYQPGVNQFENRPGLAPESTLRNGKEENHG